MAQAGPNEAYDDDDDTESFAQGQVVGDAISVIQGIAETVVGGTATGIALAAEVPSAGGSSIALPVSIPMTLHGVGLGVRGMQNLLNPTKVYAKGKGGKGGKGERNLTAKSDGTNNPFKKMKPDPKNPDNVIVKDANGKNISKLKPKGFDDYWKTKH
jgi:hypothetical protein